MRKKLIGFILMVLFSVVAVNAREVYCTITQDKLHGVVIHPNRDYLNATYWNYILFENGRRRQFTYIEDAVNHLSNFGWYVAKYEVVAVGQITYVMAHKVENYNEIRQSREEMARLSQHYDSINNR